MIKANKKEKEKAIRKLGNKMMHKKVFFFSSFFHESGESSELVWEKGLNVTNFYEGRITSYNILDKRRDPERLSEKTK